MLNIEKYANELKELKSQFAIHRVTNKVKRCIDIIDCGDCKFKNSLTSDCATQFKVWLFKDEDKFKLTKREFEMLLILKSGYVHKNTFGTLTYAEDITSVHKSYPISIAGLKFKGIPHEVGWISIEQVIKNAEVC